MPHSVACDSQFRRFGPVSIVSDRPPKQPRKMPEVAAKRPRNARRLRPDRCRGRIRSRLERRCETSGEEQPKSRETVRQKPRRMPETRAIDAEKPPLKSSPKKTSRCQVALFDNHLRHDLKFASDYFLEIISHRRYCFRRAVDRRPQMKRAAVVLVTRSRLLPRNTGRCRYGFCFFYCCARCVASRSRSHLRGPLSAA